MVQSTDSKLGVNLQRKSGLPRGNQHLDSDKCLPGCGEASVNPNCSRMAFLKAWDGIYSEHKTGNSNNTATVTMHTLC